MCQKNHIDAIVFSSDFTSPSFSRPRPISIRAVSYETMDDLTNKIARIAAKKDKADGMSMSRYNIIPYSERRNHLCVRWSDECGGTLTETESTGRKRVHIRKNAISSKCRKKLIPVWWGHNKLKQKFLQ